MNRPRPEREKIVALAAKLGVVRVRDLRQRGIHPEHLRRLSENGIFTRIGRGLYVFSSAEITPAHSMVLAAKWKPDGVVCLLSALAFHEIGTQLPRQVWIAIDRRHAPPRIDYPPIRVFRFSGSALTEGVETHKLEGVPVRIYSPAKTVVDCFKYRNKIGLDVALEALREGWRKRRFTIDEIWKFARICRVANIMRPYLEVIT
jgi:predicted transcriptional regulator of viral defense system